MESIDEEIDESNIDIEACTMETEAASDHDNGEPDYDTMDE